MLLAKLFKIYLKIKQIHLLLQMWLIKYKSSFNPIFVHTCNTTLDHEYVLGFALLNFVHLLDGWLSVFSSRTWRLHFTAGVAALII